MQMLNVNITFAKKLNREPLIGKQLEQKGQQEPS